jgi:methylated-DNA-[protein]-cysteine S-methyltransferase
LTERAINKLRHSLPDTEPVYYQSLEDTPLGDLFVAVGDQGLMAVDFGIPESRFIERVTQKTGSPPVESSDHTAEAVLQILDYLDGGRVEFDLPVDLEPLTEFQREVLDATAQIPRGQVTTYGEIARRIGRPRAARAVGQALGKNPVPIVIPCHRVISGDGTLGGYSGGGGLQSKTHLLRLEGAQLMI